MAYAHGFGTSALDTVSESVGEWRSELGDVIGEDLCDTVAARTSVGVRSHVCMIVSLHTGKKLSLPSSQGLGFCAWVDREWLRSSGAWFDGCAPVASSVSLFGVIFSNSHCCLLSSMSFLRDHP